MLVLRYIYGCIEARLLWYELYTEKLCSTGFELNTYNKFVANKETNWKQCTICLPVDDNKISHVEADVVTGIIKELEQFFGKFTVKKGNKHSYLGMNIEIFKNKKVSIDMI